MTKTQLNVLSNQYSEVKMYIIVWQDDSGNVIIDTGAPHFDDYLLAVDYIQRKNERLSQAPYYKKRYIYEVK